MGVDASPREGTPMTRTAAVLAVLAAPAVAPAQGFNLPYRTGSSFYQPSFGRYPGGFYGSFAYNPFRVPPAVPYAGFGYLSPGGFYDPGFFTTVGPNTYFVPSFAGDYARPEPPAAPPLVGAGAPAPGGPAAVAGLAPQVTPQTAELTLELPAAATVWVNGREQPGAAASRTLTSPSLPAGGSHTFDLKATWTAADGTRYEWDRRVTVAAGGRSKVTVATGFKAPG